MVWQISDGKPGHDRQVLGLINAIQDTLTNTQIELHKFDGGLLKSLKHLYLKKQNFSKRPNFIIGAGHKTHLSLLILSKLFGGKTVVLMKPSMPVKFFDICVVPKHDAIAGNNIIVTQGPINPLKNLNLKKKGGLILIGGISKHFQFDERLVLNSINKIIERNPEIKWEIADSRRTPIKMKNLLDEIKSTSTAYHDNESTDSATLDAKLQNVERVWVTSDSMAMIYEALTTGAKVGIISLPEKNNDKLFQNIKQIVSQENSHK